MYPLREMSSDGSSCFESDMSQKRESCTQNYGSSVDFTPQPQSNETSEHKSSFHFVFLASMIAAISGILFGYDTGIIAGALLQLKKEFHLSSFEQEMLVTSMLIGSFFASFFGGTIVDRFGRKKAIVFSSLLYVVGAIILCSGSKYWVLICGRVIVGVAISVSVTSECTYISEISPPDRRGMMVSLNELGITVGFLIAYLLNYAFISVNDGWRYMFGVSAIPAFIQIIGIFFMPQSPHYLIIKGDIKKAEELLKILRTRSSAEDEIKAIQTALEEENNYSFSSLLSSENNMRARMLVGMALVFLQQFSGQPSVLYYSPTVFQHFGYCSDSVATLVTVGLGIVKVVSTVFTLMTVDKFGRRCLLLTGCFFLALSIIILGAVSLTDKKAMSDNPCEKFAEDTNYTKFDYHSTSSNNTSSLEAEKLNILRKNESMNVSIRNTTNQITSDVSLATKLTSVIGLMVFVCAYGISYGPVTWLVLSEIFPTSLRGRAISVATCVNWGSNTIISLTFLQMLDEVGTGQTFLFYGCISIVAFFFVFFFLPETKNKSLEQINEEFGRSVLVKHNFCHKER